MSESVQELGDLRDRLRIADEEISRLRSVLQPVLQDAQTVVKTEERWLGSNSSGGYKRTLRLATAIIAALQPKP